MIWSWKDMIQSHYCEYVHFQYYHESPDPCAYRAAKCATNTWSLFLRDWPRLALLKAAAVSRIHYVSIKWSSLHIDPTCVGIEQPQRVYSPSYQLSSTLLCPLRRQPRLPSVFRTPSLENNPLVGLETISRTVGLTVICIQLRLV